MIECREGGLLEGGSGDEEKGRREGEVEIPGVYEPVPCDHCIHCVWHTCANKKKIKSEIEKLIEKGTAVQPASLTFNSFIFLEQFQY